jgi:hypothetical protein
LGLGFPNKFFFCIAVLSFKVFLAVRVVAIVEEGVSKWFLSV